MWKKRWDLHHEILFSWVLKSQKHGKFRCGEPLHEAGLSSTLLNSCLDWVHLIGTFHIFNRTEMFRNHTLLGFYRNSSFYFLSGFKKKIVIFLLFQNKLEMGFYSLQAYFQVCWMVPAHFHHVKYLLVWNAFGVGWGVLVLHLWVRRKLRVSGAWEAGRALKKELLPSCSLSLFREAIWIAFCLQLHSCLGREISDWAHLWPPALGYHASKSILVESTIKCLYLCSNLKMNWTQKNVVFHIIFILNLSRQ